MKNFLTILGIVGFVCGIVYSVCYGMDVAQSTWASEREAVAAASAGVLWAVLAGGVLWGLAYLVGRK
jgi:TRAP-type C4-dicarboxylate transport system permease small subunit